MDNIVYFPVQSKVGMTQDNISCPSYKDIVADDSFSLAKLITNHSEIEFVKNKA